jgi:putative phage-type endonuclease
VFNAQGSEAWRRERIGKVTASRVADLMAKTKSGWGASRKNYMAELIAERLTGVPAESYMSTAMQHGVDAESQARAAYEFFCDVQVERVGFIEHPLLKMSGASPDGFVLGDGLVELKCPNTATHIETILTREIPSKYITQMQFQMACTGRAWCDFVSFDPRMPEHLRLFTKRVLADVPYITDLEREVRAFLAEVDTTLKALDAKLSGTALML